LGAGPPPLNNQYYPPSQQPRGMPPMPNQVCVFV
jgi:hypothetical protein